MEIKLKTFYIDKMFLTLVIILFCLLTISIIVYTIHKSSKNKHEAYKYSTSNSNIIKHNNIENKIDIPVLLYKFR